MKGNDAILADELFKLGAVKFGDFKLKLHEKNPEAPLSPIYLNLRTPDNPKPGPLMPELVTLIGRLLHFMAFRAKLDYRYVVGIPLAGEPFAEAFVKKPLLGTNGNLLHLIKKEDEKGRHIIGLKETGVKPGKVVLIDDLITKADSKFEAIKVLESKGFKIAGIVVLVDREQGGGEQLVRAGYKFFSVFKISELINHYFSLFQVSKKEYDRTKDYLKRY